MSKLYLMLENGQFFEGEGFGAEYTGETAGEAVFTTGMTGYLETLTDKRHHGLIIIQTFPLAGNYGFIPDELESGDSAPRAYVVKHWCQAPSNFRSEGTLDTFLKRRGIVGLCGVDTRRLTQMIRKHGAMNACITESPDLVDLESLKSFKLSGAVKAVSVLEPEFHKSTCINGGRAPLRAVVLDLGYKRETVRELQRLGCDVTVLPYDTGAQDLMFYKPNGVVLSGGPGDPEDNPAVVDTVRELLKTGVPIMGVCLGHQILALAGGLKTVRQKHGHRGANQPVRHTGTGRVYITSQSHGYSVVTDGMPPELGRELFTNVHDGTNEGIEYTGRPVFSVQFHPDTGGPSGTSFLFGRFIKNMTQSTEDGYAQR